MSRGNYGRLSIYTCYLVYIVRDRKHGGRQKRKIVQVLRAGGSPFPLHLRFPFHDQIMPSSSFRYVFMPPAAWTDEMRVYYNCDTY